MIASKNNVLYQVSTVGAVLQGAYEAKITCAELRRHGDMGIAGIEAMDGEMIIVDGVFYQVTQDGKVLVAPEDLGIPFAMVTFFRPEHSIPLGEAADYAQFQELLDPHLGSPNLFHAIRIDGTFSYVKARSLPRQTPPYRPQVEVVQEQAVFHLNDVKGTLVGFKFPEFIEGINVPGYHLHFISDDRQHGGHVFACGLKEGTAQLQALEDFHLGLTATSDFLRANLTASGRRDMDIVQGR